MSLLLSCSFYVFNSSILLKSTQCLTAKRRERKDVFNSNVVLLLRRLNSTSTPKKTHTSPPQQYLLSNISMCPTEIHVSPFSRKPLYRVVWFFHLFESLFRFVLFVRESSGVQKKCCVLNKISRRKSVQLFEFLENFSCFRHQIKWKFVAIDSLRFKVYFLNRKNPVERKFQREFHKIFLLVQIHN